MARTGILCAVGFWILFDVCTTFSGIYARAALPGVDPRLAYPLLADLVLPAGLKGLFVVGLLATIMSTLDAYSFVGATSLSHDLLRRVLRPSSSDRGVVWATRLGVLLTSGAGDASSRSASRSRSSRSGRPSARSAPRPSWCPCCSG